MSADFSQLTDKVNEAQAQIRATMAKSRNELLAQVDRAQTVAEQQADELRANTAQAKKDWQAMEDTWHSHIAQLHQRAAGMKAERDVRKAERKAAAAEGHAEEAIGFAIAAVQEAEYAVLDAALARADAKALTDAS